MLVLLLNNSEIHPVTIQLLVWH